MFFPRKYFQKLFSFEARRGGGLILIIILLLGPDIEPIYRYKLGTEVCGGKVRSSHTLAVKLAKSGKYFWNTYPAGLT